MQHIKSEVFPKSSSVRPQTGKPLIGISLDNRTTKSDSLLLQTFDWTNRNVGAFDLLVGDYLNRHNYQAFQGESEATAIKKAMANGEQVTLRLRRLISEKYSKGIEVISAHTLYSAPRFSERLTRFQQTYTDNSHFRELIDQAVKSFLARKHAAINDNVRNHCIAYQLEELAMFELLAKAGYSSLVYAGAQLPVMKSIVSKSLSGVSHDLENLTLIELKVFTSK